jgi:DNA modification methylase
MYEAGLFYRRLNIWAYENNFSRFTREPAAHYEPFLWFSKSNDEWTYNVDEVRIPYKSTERLKTAVYSTMADGTKKAWIPNPNGAMRGDIWEYPVLAGKRFANEKTEHPTQKPEALITEIIKAFCPMVDGKYSGKILDPFHGSGTLGVCCEKLNRKGNDIKWTGIELEKKWVETAQKRLNSIPLEVDDFF